MDNFTQPEFDPMRLFTLGTNFFFYIWAIVGSACVLLTFIKYKQLRSKDCLYLIAGLALCDFLTGVTSITFVSSNILFHLGFFSSYFTKWECLLLGYGQILPLFAGQLMTMLIALDRCHAFWDQLGYRNKNHFTYAVRSLVFSLCFSGVYMGFVFVGVDYDARIPFCSLGFCWTLTFFYFYIGYLIVVGCAVLFLYLLAMALMHHATLLKLHEANPTQTAGTGSRQQQIRKPKERETSFQRQVKITKTINSVLFFYTLLWLVPMGVLLAAIFVEVPLWLLGILEPIADTGVGLNCSVNVIIYAVKHKVMRAFLLGLFKCKSASSVQP